MMSRKHRFYSFKLLLKDLLLQHWLYPDKKIGKQLKGKPIFISNMEMHKNTGLPWEFFFKVKFYPPNPTQLSEDFTRHLLYLQLRKDVYSER